MRLAGFCTRRRSKVPEVIMPKMGDAMEEGTLLKWLKSEGEEVSEGDPIAEIETDKVTMELEAEDGGTLAQLIADEGQDVPVARKMVAERRPPPPRPRRLRKRRLRRRPRYRLMAGPTDTSGPLP
jgi:hypothetical protein